MGPPAGKNRSGTTRTERRSEAYRSGTNVRPRRARRSLVLHRKPLSGRGIDAWLRCAREAAHHLAALTCTDMSRAVVPFLAGCSTRRIPFACQEVPVRTRFLLILASLLLPAFAASARGSCLQPDKLVILSTTDVKGRTGPCGGHVPKGGLARGAGCADSVRAQFGQVALVDAGGFLPEEDGQQDRAAFMIDAMNLMNTDAVGIAERDLRYGASFLSAQTKRSKLPVVCDILIEKSWGRHMFSRSEI